MSLRWTRTLLGRFPCIITSLEQSLLQSFFVNSVIDKVVKHLLAYLSLQKWFAGDIPLLREKLAEIDQPPSITIADFQWIFARSTSAVTPSKKRPVKTNRKSTTSFPMSLRWSVYVAPKLHEGLLKNAVSKIWTIIITLKRHEIGCQLVLITHMKSFDWHRPRWPWMALNGVIALNLRFFHWIR